MLYSATRPRWIGAKAPDVLILVARWNGVRLSRTGIPVASGELSFLPLLEIECSGIAVSRSRLTNHMGAPYGAVHIEPRIAGISCQSALANWYQQADTQRTRCQTCVVWLQSFHFVSFVTNGFLQVVEARQEPGFLRPRKSKAAPQRVLNQTPRRALC